MSLNEQQKIMAETLNGIMSVDAGPGTGKTHTVTCRFINMIREGIDPSQILLLTFTRNAAGEMAVRIRKDMKDVAGKLPASDPVRASLVRACDNIRASTFDAFCLRIVLSSPDAVNEFFGFEETLSRGAKLIQNETLNKDDFRSFYAGFTEKYGDTYRRSTDYPAVVAGRTDDLYGLITRLMSFGIIPMKGVEWFADGEKRLRGREKEVYDLLVSKNLPGVLHLDRNHTYSPDKPDELFTSVSKKGVPLSPETLELAACEDRSGLIEFVWHVYYEYIRYAVRSNRLTFSLVKIFAFISLYSSSFVRSQNASKYLMVDEFQDTDDIQLKICMMLLSEPNLCVVGDWKQGIYGFRNASVENLMFFEDKVKEICLSLGNRVAFDIDDAEILTIPLEVNYRSSDVILEHSFRSLYAPGKEDEAKTTVQPEGNVVSLKSFRVSEKNKHAAEYAKYTGFEAYVSEDKGSEYSSICDKISEYVYSGNYRIVEDDGSVRPPRFGDIAVLFRTGNAAIKLYQTACDRKIPAFLQGDMEIMSSVPGKIALAWLRLVNDPGDKRAVSAILSFEGMSMSQITEIYRRAFGRDGEGGIGLYEAIPERTREQRRFLKSKVRRSNDLLTSIFSYYRMPEDPRYADNVQAIISVLSSAYSGSLITVSDMIRLIEQDIENGTDYRVDAALDFNAVTIQTMHKSKGLEYPIVIVGGLNQGTMPQYDKDGNVFRYDEKHGWGLRCRKEVAVAENGTSGITDSWRFDVLKRAQSADYDEERRLLFVSMTRAKQYLFMSAGGNPSTFFTYTVDDGECRKPAACTIDQDDSSEALSEPPEIGGYVRRRRNIAVHDIMPYIPGDSSNENSTAYGNKVHEAAQLLALGKECDGSYPELSMIKNVLAHCRGHDIRAEYDCALPVGDITIRGIIDLFVDFGDRIEIHDWKTGNDMRNHESYVLQLSVYYHAASMATGKPVRCFIDYVTLGQSVEVTGIVPLDVIEEKAADFLKDSEMPVGENQ